MVSRDFLVFLISQATGLVSPYPFFLLQFQWAFYTNSRGILKRQQLQSKPNCRPDGYFISLFIYMIDMMYPFTFSQFSWCYLPLLKSFMTFFIEGQSDNDVITQTEEKILDKLFIFLVSMPSKIMDNLIFCLLDCKAIWAVEKNLIEEIWLSQVNSESSQKPSFPMPCSFVYSWNITLKWVASTWTLLYAVSSNGTLLKARKYFSLGRNRKEI